MMDLSFFITSFVALFVIIDPIGLAPLFVAITSGMDPKYRRSVAIRSIITAFGVLLLFSVGGEAILGFAGISMSAFRIAGGILLFLTALEMLFERRTKRRSDQTEEEAHDPSVFPLAIPLIAGPGAITTVILLSGNSPGLQGFFAVTAVIFAVLLVVALFFSAAGTLERLLGRTGTNVVTRILGMLLAAMSVQFVLDGLRGFGFG